MLQFLRFRALHFGSRLVTTPFSWLLAPAAWMWRFIAALRNYLYDAHFFPTYTAPVPVISVGNISVGGTGKTPLVILLAKHFSNRKVAILARGYGAKRGELNDEMKVIARHVPTARLYQGIDRVRLAKLAVSDGAELLLLDDGFQHRRLNRDFDLVVVRPRDLIDFFLPRGRLRDSPKRLLEATAVFSYTPIDYPATLLQSRPTRIVDRQGQNISSIRGQRVALFCGIGYPDRFKKTVVDLGAQIVAEKILSDHEPFTGIEIFFEECKKLDIKYLICTEKDFVKLPASDLPLIWVEIEAEVINGQEDWQKLIAKIDDRLNN